MFFFLRVIVVMLLVFCQTAFLNILFPSLGTPQLLLASVVAWTLIAGFPESLKMIVPLSILFDIMTSGWIGIFSVYAVFLSYVTSFLSRRLLVEHRGMGMWLYALFAGGGALAHEAIFFLFSNRHAIFSKMIVTHAWQVFFLLPASFSFFLSIFLFFPAYIGLKYLHEYIAFREQTFIGLR